MCETLFGGRCRLELGELWEPGIPLHTCGCLEVSPPSLLINTESREPSACTKAFHTNSHVWDLHQLLILQLE